MKRIIAITLVSFLPLISIAQETVEVAVVNNPKADRLTELLSWSLIFVAIAFIILAIAVLMLKSPDRKNEILNSNIDRIKAELKMKGFHPENALIDILHRESSLYTGPPEPIVMAEKEVEIIELEANTDHSLVLKIADELVRIQKNLSNMDEKTRGLKQLNASVTRIANNFSANGYELVQMLNKPYREGMMAAVSFVSSDEIPTGQQLITRIIKPQVNYNGEMIQSAQIEVSVGE